MIQNRKIAFNYASALSELALNKLDTLQEFYNALDSINIALKEVKNSTLVFNSPAVSAEDKKKNLTSIINKIPMTGGKTQLLNFLSLLIDKQRFNLLPEIQSELKCIIDDLNNLVHAEVYSAVKLDDNTLNKIREKLEKNFFSPNNKIEITSTIEKSLIGGIKIKLKDQVIDGSIKGKLEGLKKKIIV